MIKNNTTACFEYDVSKTFARQGDLKNAFEWCLKSANRGHFDAQFSVATYLEYGIPEQRELFNKRSILIGRNLTESWKWYKKAKISSEKIKYVTLHLPSTTEPTSCFYNFDHHEHCRNTILYFILITKPFLPKDIYLLISHKIWHTRDDESWE
jgi:hypothetical protein